MRHVNKGGADSKDPWRKVKRRDGKLTGGLLTDDLLYSIFGSNSIKESKNFTTPITLGQTRMGRSRR